MILPVTASGQMEPNSPNGSQYLIIVFSFISNVIVNV
jgi:hypothetical protein